MRVAVFHNIGEPNRETFTNSIEQIKNFDGLVTFDGIYDSVWEHREEIGEIARGKYGVWLFFAGGTIGTPGFITKQQLLTLVDEYDCLMGWHTWSHPKLNMLTDAEIRHQLDAPAWVPRLAFAYPHGDFDDRVIELVKEAGYKKAYSTTQGNDDKYSIYREYL